MKFESIKLDNVKFKSTLLSIAISTLLLTGKANAIQEQQFSGINQVKFNNAEYDNAFAGNAFLISFNEKLFAVTVKHALMVEKTLR
ncbi:hypothetical protein [Thalassotalea fusca]